MPRSVPSIALPAWRDPEAVFVHLLQAEPTVFWLDAGGDARTGLSWMGVGTPEIHVDPLDRDATGSMSHTTPEGPVPGAWVGWLPYEGGRGEASWIRVTSVLAFDHAARSVRAMGERAAEWAAGAAAAPPAPSMGVAPPAIAEARHDPEQYAQLIARCRDRIADGDAYQLCLTTRFTVAGAFDPVAVFRRLRAQAPSHHGGLIRLGDNALVSASPERFLEVRDGRVHTHPIKGTRPRSADPARDAALAEQLRTDAKERAENVMIVDLMRNDFSRVCVASSIAVDRLLEVESYPTVHQLVSEVSGRLRPGTTLARVVEASFPAGSMTGAPKVSAMHILAELEGAPRGVYAGAFGWIDRGGRADLAMVIRSIVIEPDAAWVGAGGGITWRSVAAAEVAEVGIKARAPLAALGAEVPPGW